MKVLLYAIIAMQILGNIALYQHIRAHQQVMIRIPEDIKPYLLDYLREKGEDNEGTTAPQRRPGASKI